MSAASLPYRLPTSSLEFTEEKALLDVEQAAREVMLATIPTTRDGQNLLLEWVQAYADGEPADGYEGVWADAYRSIAAALSAPLVLPREGWAQGQADAVSLSGLAAPRLCNLYEAFRRAADLWSDASCLPYAEDTAAGRVVDDEYARASMVQDRIFGLLRTRAPADDRERDAILDVLIRHEIACEGGIQDRALLARINASWGGSVRG